MVVEVRTKSAREPAPAWMSADLRRALHDVDPSVPPSTRGTAKRIAPVIVIWAIAVVAGLGALASYAATPGGAANAPATWPAASTLHRASDRPTLVLVAHPLCSCTRASLGELSRLMTQLHGRVRAYVLFATLERGETWAHSDLHDRASEIRDVEVVTDVGGREAARFGAVTSGQTYLYAADGRLLFSGGITAARGHAGDNVGSSRILSLVASRHADRNGSPVFGCPIFDTEKRGGT